MIFLGHKIKPDVTNPKFGPSFSQSAYGQTTASSWQDDFYRSLQSYSYFTLNLVAHFNLADDGIKDANYE